MQLNAILKVDRHVLARGWRRDDHAWLVPGATKDRPLTVRAVSTQRPLIVHVTRQFLPNRGGLEDVIYNLCRQLVKRGFRVRVVTLDRLFSNPDLALPKTELIDGIEVVRIPWRGSSRYPVAPQVFRHIRDADLVHVHAVDFFFDALSWTRLLHGRPLVATTHGGFFHTTNHARIKKIWFQTVTRLSCMGYRQLACCSLSDATLFRRIAGEQTIMIENGADLSKFSDRGSKVPTRRVVTIGRFSSNKRLDHLIRTMVPLVRKDPAWRLDIVGVESDLNRADLERLVSDTGLQDKIGLHVGLSNEEVAALLGQASIFASASEYEGFGLVAIEAMSAGLVPILHENQAYRELAKKHRLLTITDFSNPETAAKAVEAGFARLQAEGGELRDKLMQDAAIYSWETVTDRYLAAYEEAVPGITR